MVVFAFPESTFLYLGFALAPSAAEFAASDAAAARDEAGRLGCRYRPVDGEQGAPRIFWFPDFSRLCEAENFPPLPSAAKLAASNR
jgi:hypothetical protein